MGLKYNNDILAKIPALLWDLEKERVAVLVGKVAGTMIIVFDIWQATNSHSDPYDNFGLGSAEWQRLKRRAAREGCRIIGVAHGHTRAHPAEPSKNDLGRARRWRSISIGLVFHSTTGQVTWYDRQGIKEIRHVRLPLWMRITNRIFR